jgi:choline dehydrogenase-like flavoprotein
MSAKASYDAIVIGAGAGGTAAAYGLVRAGWASSPLPMALSADILSNPREATHFDLPRSSRVNPSLSIYAWGLRVADLLAKTQIRRGQDARDL